MKQPDVSFKTLKYLRLITFVLDSGLSSVAYNFFLQEIVIFVLLVGDDWRIYAPMEYTFTDSENCFLSVSPFTDMD